MRAKRTQQRQDRWHKEYRCLSRQVAGGEGDRAEAALRKLVSQQIPDQHLRALCHNDLGVALAARGADEEAREQFGLALAADSECAAARENLTRLGHTEEHRPPPPVLSSPGTGALRIAILGLLFNWVQETTGGGCAHTVGLGKALAAEGHEVRHFYARNEEFGVGQVNKPCPLEGEPVDFDLASWHCEGIKAGFRQAVDSFSPDLVIVTDTWNFKPHLVQAMAGYPVWMRFDAQECLCPLNNCRFLIGPQDTFSQCQYHQLATPETCARCLQERGQTSGFLHQAERVLSGVGEQHYLATLRSALQQADLLLVNNHLIREMLSPYGREVRAVPPGVDAGRFPWRDEGGPERQGGEPKVIFMAGVIEEPFKGFGTLHEACARLWQRRRDFRLVATGAEPGRRDEYTEFTGWLSQEALPEHYRAADICVAPSWVQDAWPMVAVEAMAAGRPLVASRIGGLQEMIGHGTTGLLCEPGDVEALLGCLERLLDDTELRRQMGRQARRQFEESGSWEAVMARHYRPLLARARGGVSA